MVDTVLQNLNPTGKQLNIDSKQIELFINEAHRMIVMRITDSKTGKVESLVGMDAATAAKHARDMFTVCNKIRSFGNIILPGDPNFKAGA